MDRRSSEATRARATQHQLRGTPVSGGRVTGPARIVRDQVDVARVRPGEIVVCANVASVQAVLKLASGIIAETGGALTSPAIVAREYRIPAVFAVRGATASSADGQDATVDGASGIVFVQV